MATVILVMMLSFLLYLPSAAQSAMPPVHFKFESDAGLEMARTCGEIWKSEGPTLVSDLAPFTASFDTVTCFILDTDSFTRNFSGRLPDWGVGVAMPGGRLVAIDYSRLPAIGRGIKEVFLHEMVHAILFQVSADTWLPTWFHEGCAMKFSGEWKFSDTVSLVLDGKVPSLDHLQGRFPIPAGQADRAYRTSLLAVNRLIDQYGSHILGEILSETASSETFSLAFKKSTGVGMSEFTDDFASAMNLRLGWAVILTRWPTLFVLMSLIFATGAARKMIQTRRRLAEMDDEEESID
ncbi:MAG: hypothetical protein GY780_12620 [bacterium]|nr:hypothetical protein [bacterium]